MDTDVLTAPKALIWILDNPWGGIEIDGVHYSVVDIEEYPETDRLKFDRGEWLEVAFSEHSSVYARRISGTVEFKVEKW